MKKTMEEQQEALIQRDKAPTDAPRHQILPTLFEEHVKKYPHHTALIFNKEKLSYYNLNEKSNQIAHYLRHINANNKLFIAVCMKPSFDLLISILGILKAGCAYIPLDPDNPPARLQFILDDTQAKIILTHSSEKSLFEKNNVRLICLDTHPLETDNYPLHNPAIINQANDLAYIIYTSGSTGTPKGVLITHQNVMYFTHWFSKALSVTREDIFDFSSSVSFDFAVANTLFPLMQGATVVICPQNIKKDPYLYSNHLLETKVTIIKTTPSHFRSLKEVVLNEKIDIPLKYIVFGGDSLFASDIKDWLEQFPKQIMFCEYGPTEATVATSWIKVDKNNINHFEHKIPIGKPALNTKLYLLDDHLQPVPIGETAELYIGGKGVATGYLNQQTMTEKKFIVNPFNNNPDDRLYKTGDFCRLLKDGNIEFVERMDNQTKIRGFRIEMEEIESYLISYPGIKEAIVIAKQFGDYQETEKQLIAYCVPRNSMEINVPELRKYLTQQLPEYMVPAFFETITALPLSANGKVDRKKLPEPTRSIHQPETIPCSELELNLKQIWEDTLCLRGIDVTNNFFDLGGHSLAAARIIAKIRQTIKKEILLSDFYSKPTIRDLANHISKTNVSCKNEEIEQINPGPDSTQIPLSELQFLFWLMQLFYPTARILNITSRKRMCGRLDRSLLNTALDYTCKNHSILHYKIPRFSPIQYWQQLPPPKVVEIDIKHLSTEQQEIELRSSMDELQQLSWKRNKRLFQVRLFSLGDDLSELQVTFSHLISDEMSPTLFFKTLSEYYLSLLHHKQISIDPDRGQYRNYVLYEAALLKKTLPTHINFWETYLRGTPFLGFPPKFLTKNNEAFNTAYISIPEIILEHLQEFSTENQLFMTDSLTAAVASCLATYIENDNKCMIINLVKSTRDNEAYDNAIGLFVRTDLIKIDLNNSPDFLQASRRVQKSIIETAPYQSCPVIVKLGCLFKKESENHKISTTITGFFSKIYTKLFPQFKLDYRVLTMFSRVFFTRKIHGFFVDINIMNNFLSTPKDISLFGLELKKVDFSQSDKTVDKNILNIWFDRDSENAANLILSGNLHLSFLEKIGQDIINIISLASFKEKL